MYIFSFIHSLSPSLFAFHVFLPHCAKLKKKKCNFLQSVSLLTMTIKYCGNNFLHTLGPLSYPSTALYIKTLFLSRYSRPSISMPFNCFQSYPIGYHLGNSGSKWSPVPISHPTWVPPKLLLGMTQSGLGKLSYQWRSYISRWPHLISESFACHHYSP